MAFDVVVVVRCAKDDSSVDDIEEPPQLHQLPVEAFAAQEIVVNVTMFEDAGGTM